MHFERLYESTFRISGLPGIFLHDMRGSFYESEDIVDALKMFLKQSRTTQDSPRYYFYHAKNIQNDLWISSEDILNAKDLSKIAHEYLHWMRKTSQ